MFRWWMLFRRIRRSNQTYRSLRVPVHFPFQMFRSSERTSTVTIALSDQHRILAEFDPFYRSKLQLRVMRDYFAHGVLFATTILQNTLCNSIPKLTAGDSRSWNFSRRREKSGRKKQKRGKRRGGKESSLSGNRAQVCQSIRVLGETKGPQDGCPRTYTRAPASPASAT